MLRDARFECFSKYISIPQHLEDGDQGGRNAKRSAWTFTI